MKKILLIEKRKKAQELHKKKWSIRKIARHLIASKNNVGNWVKMSAEELLNDDRSWRKGKLRKYTQEQKDSVIKIRIDLEKEESFFVGSKVIRANYRNQYGTELSKWFIDNTLKEAGLVKSPPMKRHNKSRYMQYPKHTLRHLGKSMMSIDFIGPKYLKGSNDRINFLSCKYIRPNQYGIVKRIDGQTTQQTIEVLKTLWQDHSLPDVLKVDNDAAFGTNSIHKQMLGKFTLFLLNIGVSPLYIAPRSPWNNGEVEGFNSVFSKKFWNKLQFTDEDEIDIKIHDFNLAYEKYSTLINNNPTVEQPQYIGELKQVDYGNKKLSGFKTTTIYFLRIVRRRGEKSTQKEHGYIDILGVEIKMSIALINLFVLCQLELKKQKIIIRMETPEGKLETIKTIKYKVKNLDYE